MASPLNLIGLPMDCERSLVAPNHRTARRSIPRTAHMHRWVAGAACVCALALPFTVAWVRDGAAESRTALTETESRTALTATTSHAITPAIVHVPVRTGDRSADVEYAGMM